MADRISAILNGKQSDFPNPLQFDADMLQNVRDIMKKVQSLGLTASCAEHLTAHTAMMCTVFHFMHEKFGTPKCDMKLLLEGIKEEMGAFIDKL